MKRYVKTKEFGPVGGGRAPETFVCRSATVMDSCILSYCHQCWGWECKDQNNSKTFQLILYPPTVQTNEGLIQNSALLDILRVNS